MIRAVLLGATAGAAAASSFMVSIWVISEVLAREFEPETARTQ